MSRPGARCETCAFRGEGSTTNHVGDTVVWCRRRAPIVDLGLLVHPGAVTRRTWPAVLLTDWCGEWRPAETLLEALEQKGGAS